MSDAVKVIFMEQERDEARRQLTYALTAIRNALEEIAEGNIDAAVETLKQIVS